MLVIIITKLILITKAWLFCLLGIVGLACMGRSWTGYEMYDPFKWAMYYIFAPYIIYTELKDIFKKKKTKQNSPRYRITKVTHRRGN
jgi:hypothetical protein